MKFNVMYGVGSTRYVVNFWDGVKAHQDGSAFFDIRLFSNKRKMEAFVRDLRQSGYVEN